MVKIMQMLHETYTLEPLLSDLQLSNFSDNQFLYARHVVGFHPYLQCSQPEG